MDILALLPQLPTLDEIVTWGGYIGLAVIIFSETGLLVGFFLPGDSLLVTAGLFAARGQLDITLLCPLLLAAAIAGNTTGYFIGRKLGPALFDKPQSRFFRRDHLVKTHEFYEKYGGVTIIMAQFMPFARTFAPVVAGIAAMEYRRFALFNITGAVLWIPGMTLLGYFLGLTFPGVVKHIELLVLVIVFISILPIIIKYLLHRFKRQPLAEKEL